jgi:hypothetical protein
MQYEIINDRLQAFYRMNKNIKLWEKKQKHL